MGKDGAALEDHQQIKENQAHSPDSPRQDIKWYIVILAARQKRSVRSRLEQGKLEIDQDKSSIGPARAPGNPGGNDQDQVNQRNPKQVLPSQPALDNQRQ